MYKRQLYQQFFQFLFITFLICQRLYLVEKKGMIELKKLIMFLGIFYLFTHSNAVNNQFFQSIGQKASKPVHDIQDKIVERVKSDVNKTYKDTKITLFTEVTNIDETKDLVNEGFGYTDILKLNIMSQITKRSISQLIEVNGVVTSDPTGSKQVNLAQLLEIYSISEEELKNKLEEYKALSMDSFYQLIDLD
jgi:hypothetical protein